MATLSSGVLSYIQGAGAATFGSPMTAGSAPYDVTTITGATGKSSVFIDCNGGTVYELELHRFQGGTVTPPMPLVVAIFFDGTTQYNFSTDSDAVLVYTDSVNASKSYLVVIGQNIVNQLPPPPKPCLIQGTMVRTPTSLVPIESLQIGDIVLNQHYKPVKITKITNRKIQYQSNPIESRALSDVIYTIPAGKLGANSNVYLTKHHQFMIEDGSMKKPEEYGLRRAEPSEICDASGHYIVHHLRLEDSYNNHFIVNGNCIVEDWWEWPRPNRV